MQGVHWRVNVGPYAPRRTVRVLSDRHIVDCSRSSKSLQLGANSVGVLTLRNERICVEVRTGRTSVGGATDPRRSVYFLTDIIVDYTRFSKSLQLGANSVGVLTLRNERTCVAVRIGRTSVGGATDPRGGGFLNDFPHTEHNLLNFRDGCCEVLSKWLS